MALLKRLASRVRDRLLLTHLLPRLSDLLVEHGRRLWDLDRRMRLVQEALGRIEARQQRDDPDLALQAREFRVYSQWGEDGILEHLCRHVPIPRKVFIEFGVENYEEANTRFLLVSGNWAGLVIDGSEQHIAQIRNSRVYWLHNLKAVHAFITRENINQILRENGVTGEIGLLSIDIDGMDYWVWEAITVVQPAIVVIEYNHRFGAERAVTVPYDATFDRRKAHHSLVYYGASLRAMVELGARKGYDFVGCGSAGLNAFFVRGDFRPSQIAVMSVEQGFVAGQFCETHDAQAQRIKMSEEDQRRILDKLPLVEVNGSTNR
jgi:hypothetical protein